MDLARTQLLSLITKAVTTSFGIIQSIIIIRLLTPADYGLVGLVLSIGGVIGVTQHLGIVDGVIREIAILKNKTEAGKVFWVSHLVRQAVTIPLSSALFMAAPFVATKLYDRPEIIPYIQLFAAVLVLQGLQDVLGATLTGIKKFGALYITQIATAIINIIVFGYLTWQFGISGFFIAIIVTTCLMVAIMYLILSRHSIEFAPRSISKIGLDSIKKYLRRVMRIGAYMYVARIFFVVWQRLPLLILGAVVSAEELGYLNVSLTFGSRLTIIAMALSEVNLSWMSSLYLDKRPEFSRVVTRNMQRVLVVMSFLTLILLFFTPEILRYVIGSEYLPAKHIILLMTLAFFLYSLMDIGTSSVFVPADKPRSRAQIYAVMLSITALLTIWLVKTRPDALLASLAVLFGALVAYVCMVILVKRQFNISLLTRPLLIVLLALFTSAAWLFTDPPAEQRTLIFLGLIAYTFWVARRSQLLPSFNLAIDHQPNSLLPRRIICFSGASYDAPSWTNRQHIMSRVSKRMPVLYVEPRVWIMRYFWQNWRHPKRLANFLWRLIGYEKKHSKLIIVSQWNLLPGSRENKLVAWCNHWLLNRWRIILLAKLLGFYPPGKFNKHLIVWIYDTEAAEYLSAYRDNFVLYDCVDDHAAQAGPDRNPAKVRAEEKAILRQADLVTVTSQKLYEQKKSWNKNVNLVINAGDVALFIQPSKYKPAFDFADGRPIIGTVGALDSYKIDFDLLQTVATKKPTWHFVFVGAPVVERMSRELWAIMKLPNVHIYREVPREDVPDYVYKFDVCMIAYKNSAYNAASFPLKFWEFMATGKPIVVSGVPELKVYSHLITYTETDELFINGIEAALQSPDLSSLARRTEARIHSWDNRVEQLFELINIKVVQ